MLVIDKWQMRKDQVEACSQAKWYVYSRQRISEATFDDKLFQKMLCSGNFGCKILTCYQLKTYIHVEFEFFATFLKFVLEWKLNESKGNPFALGLHDGVTLGNYQGYESLALNFISPEWKSQKKIPCTN